MSAFIWPPPDADADLLALVEGATDAIAIYDHAFRFLYRNAAARQSSALRDTLIGRVLWEAFPETREHYEEPLTRAMRECIPLQFEAHYAPTQSWTECRCLPLGTEDVDYRPRLAVFYHDITQRRRDELAIRAADNALRTSETRYQRLLDTSINGVALIDERDEYTYANPRFAEIVGYDSPEEIVGLSALVFAFPEDEATVRTRRAARRQGIGEQYQMRIRRRDGSEAWAMMSVNPEHDPVSDAYKGTFLVMTDVTQRVLAEKALSLAYDREQARAEREALLSNAGTVLNASLDYRETLITVAKLIVPRFADWCSVDLFDDKGVLQRVAVEHVDPAKVAWGWELHRRYPPKLDAETGMAVVLRDGTSQFVPHITDEMLAAGIADAEYLSIVRQIGLNSVIMVPLAARGRIFGAVSLIATQESDRHFTADDMRLAEELSRRAALAIENARLFRTVQESETRQRRIAETLQRSMLLAPEEEAIPGLRIGTHYEAAWDEAQVGGDFFDVLRLGEDRVALIVGDSTGKGLNAARYTSEMLFVLRAYLRENPNPAAALSRLNTYLIDCQRFDRRSENGLAAVAVAVVSLTTGELLVASGGAEPALLLRAETGTAYEIDSSGTVLGAEANVTYDDVRLSVSPGDLILLVTDGLTEARNRKTRQFFGYDGFTRSVEEVGCDIARSLNEVAEDLVVCAKTFAGGALTDDVCLMVARYG